MTEKEAKVAKVGSHQPTHLAVSAAAALNNHETFSALVALVPSAIVTISGDSQHIKSVITRLSERNIIDPSVRVTLKGEHTKSVIASLHTDPMSVRVTLRAEPKHMKSVMAGLSDRAIMDSAAVTLRPKGGSVG